MFNRLFNSEFSKNVVTLATGTTIAQAIPIAISPILTRIYTPEDFGVFALYLSITAILSSIVNGKYEMAIMLPKTDLEALTIVKLSLYISCTISVLFFLIFLFSKHQISLWLNEPNIENWLLLIPISIFIAGLYNALNYYNTRNRLYSQVSKSQVSKSLGLSVGQISLGFMNLAHGGLVLGNLVSRLFGNLILFEALKPKLNVIKNIGFDNCRAVAKRFKKFPLFSMPSVLLNSVTLNSTNFFIAAIFSSKFLGFYALSNKILGLPSLVIGGSIGQVYYQEACMIRNERRSILPLFLATLLKLVFISVPIFVILYFTVSPVFELVFGKDWVMAGTMAQIVIPLVAFRFVSSTLSSTMVILERQEYSFFINIILLTTTVAVFYFAYYSQCDIFQTLRIFTFSLSFCYITFCYVYYRLAKKTNVELDD